MPENTKQTTVTYSHTQGLDGGYGWVVVLGSFLAHLVIDKYSAPFIYVFSN